MVVLKELILNSFLLWEGVVVLKELVFCLVSTLGECDGLERTGFELVSTLGGFGSHSMSIERTDFKQFLFWEGVVVLIELILKLVSTLGGCCSLERTDFKQFLL